jgi:hypothetical protein
MNKKERTMQNKKLLILLGVILLLVGGAAFLGGRLLNGNLGSLGMGMPLGNSGMVSISVQMTPAPELPTTRATLIGSYVERKDNSIIVASAPMEAGKGGVVLSINNSDGGDEGEPSTSGNAPDGPKVEVVISKETTIYLEDTNLGAPEPGETNKVVQQTVKGASLDDLTSQSFVSVWGRKSGDRVIADVVLISNPVMYKKP